MKNHKIQTHQDFQEKTAQTTQGKAVAARKIYRVKNCPGCLFFNPDNKDFAVYRIVGEVKHYCTRQKRLIIQCPNNNFICLQKQNETK